MATFIELRNLMDDSDLRNKVTTAVMIAADTVMRGNDNVTPFSQTAGDHDIRIVWAKLTFENPKGQAQNFLMSLLAFNVGATVTAIKNATDASIQTRVDTAVDMLAGVVV